MLGGELRGQDGALLAREECWSAGNSTGSFPKPPHETDEFQSKSQTSSGVGILSFFQSERMHGTLLCACPKLRAVPGTRLCTFLAPEITRTLSERDATLEITLHAREYLIRAKFFPKRILDNINFSVILVINYSLHFFQRISMSQCIKTIT